MRFGDIMGTCLNNLFRHKARTILTITGVIVGCCSVVMMISIGMAMKLQMMSFMDEMGDLSIIEVSAPGNKKLDDTVVKQLKNIPGVKVVSPAFRAEDIEIKLCTADGRYITQYAGIVGIDGSIMEDFGYTAKEGALLSGTNIPGIVFGENAVYEFTDSMRPEGYNQINYWDYIYSDDEEKRELPDPFFDPMTEKFKLVISSPDKPNNKAEFDVPMAGILNSDEGKGYETISGFFVDTAYLNGIINQFKSDNGLSVNSVINYDIIKIKPVDIRDVPDITDRVKQLGYEAYSMESMRESMEKEANNVQLMFAVLGAVSLFVAALGIMNTMIMAISERTREIGVMKALGCFVGDIRKIFLCEAGLIGLIGGVIGSVASLVLSIAANILILNIDIKNTPFSEVVDHLTTGTDRISVIPWQLAVGAVVFSVLVGIISGYYPANRAATKISALDAIKSE